MKQIIRRYAEVKHRIQPGDLLFYRRGWKPSNFLIARIGGSPRVHVGMADLHRGRLVILETLQFKGAQRSPLLEQVTRYPGHWDHFETNPDNRWPEWDRERAVAYMRDAIGQPYGYGSLALAGIRHLPFVRLFIRPDTSDELQPNGLLPYCSHLCTLAIQWGGVDMVPNRPNRLVDPGRASESMFVGYKCTLVPDDE